MTNLLNINASVALVLEMRSERIGIREEKVEKKIKQKKRQIFNFCSRDNEGSLDQIVIFFL